MKSCDNKANDKKLLYAICGIRWQIQVRFQFSLYFKKASAKKSDLMIADGLNRQQRIAIRDEIEYHQHQLAELYDLLQELKQNFENSLMSYEQGASEFSEYFERRHITMGTRFQILRLFGISQYDSGLLF